MNSKIMTEIFCLGKKTVPSKLNRYLELIEECQNEGKFLSFDKSIDWLPCYATDGQSLHIQYPILVFRPYTTANIASFIRACYEREIPIATRCGGTGLSGGCLSSTEGVVLLTGHLKRISNYDKNIGTLSIEPGVTVKQLNQHVSQGGWYFPLSLATEGVSGIAGCLSVNARGYHQQQQSPYQLIERVTLINGKGEIVEVPSSFVCGAEGLWGIIIEIKMGLKKKSESSQLFRFSGSWNEIISKLSCFQANQAITGIIWNQRAFYFRLEGESWRLSGAMAHLSKSLPKLVRIDDSIEKISHAFIPTHSQFTVIGSQFEIKQLSDASDRANEIAQELQLECIQMADLLAGSLHLIIQTAAEERIIFAKKCEQFLLLWVDYLDKHQGMLSGGHGIGSCFRHYMPPFWTEETQNHWRNIQRIYDPKKLFEKDRFFPVEGKSLEKRSNEGNP